MQRVYGSLQRLLELFGHALDSPWCAYESYFRL